ncbi:diacylglycerol kinase family protein [Natranaerobius trueperi]|uniref:DAGKc domain-containing protein n=1 Tax=Natranaerobius trueperi TaxID=759412 RepID=A0A226C2E6_9FIRM|nr:diacylglycerol kinase family protein [Natranaerobius trueperi]OWZ84784.1 hypothetical protein CDO51_01840 [Natranaerobius trueperi]
MNYKFKFTQKPKDAGNLVSSLIKEGCCKIIIIGGDVTLHEAINGQNIDFRKVTLGIIPTGTMTL